MITTVFIKDLKLLASIGVHETEKNQPQTIIVNVELNVLRNDLNDKLPTTVCYETLISRINALVNSVHFNLAETLCYEIARIALEDSRVEIVKVKITKPEIIKNAIVGAEILIKREDLTNHSFRQ